MQAAVDLWTRRSTSQYRNVPLKQCGFMFMATPHYGSHLAETGKLANGVLALSGRRKEMLGPMQGEQHNKCIEEHQDVWTDFFNNGEVGHRPIVCFSESRESRILHGLSHTVVRTITRHVFQLLTLISCQIVKRQNARWMHVNAEEIAETDHHSICTYSSANDNGYEIIVQRLGEIRKKLRSPELHLSNDESTSDAPAGTSGAEQTLQQQNIAAASLSKQRHLTARPAEILLDHCDPESDMSKHFTRFEKLSWHEERPDSLPQAQCVIEKTRLLDGALGPRRLSSSKSTVTILQVQAQSEFMPLYLRELMAGSPGKEIRSRSDVPVSIHNGATPRARSRMDSEDTSLKDSVLQFTRPTSPQTNIAGVIEQSPPADVVNAWREQSSLSLGNHYEAMLSEDYLQANSQPDGGRLRGYSALLVLKMLMAEISEIESEDDSAWRKDLRPWKDANPTISIIRRSSSYSSQFSDRVVDSMRRRSTSPLRNEKRYMEIYLPCHYFDYITGIGTGGSVVPRRRSILCLIIQAVLLQSCWDAFVCQSNSALSGTNPWQRNRSNYPTTP